MAEKKKLRIVNGKKTLTTYKRFRKRFKSASYDRKSKKYTSFTPELRIKRRRIKRRAVRQETEPPRPINRERIRKQVAINFRSNEDPYFISVRAITINPDIGERALLIAVKETIQRKGYNLSGFSSKYTGYSYQKIPSSVDRSLNDERIHVEVMIKKGRPEIYII